MADATTVVEPYTAVALQLSCEAINRAQSREEARAIMMSRIGTIAEYTGGAASILANFFGGNVRLVLLPEYCITGFPIKETIPEWREKGCLDYDGPEYEALARICDQHDLYLAGNVYERDPNFSEIYFQTCFIMSPAGEIVLRYRRLTSTFDPTPYDVWDQYLDIYGMDGVFPVARTEIGNIGAIASEEILYPEFSRGSVLRGAEIILHPTSEVGSPQLTEKEICRRSRAVENMAYVIASNTATIENIPIPAYTCSAMSKIVDYKGRVMAEAAAGGESYAANTIIDIEALRKYRRRVGMSNLLSRNTPVIHAASYGDRDIHPANTLIEDGQVLVPDRARFRQRQQAVVEKLSDAGII